MTTKHRNRRRTLPALLLAGLMMAAPAASAGDFSPELATLDLEDLLDVDLVYGASKFEQRTAEAPASIAVIRADEIQRFGYRSLSEILRNVRSFYVTNDRIYDYVGVRGFSRPGDYNTRMLVLIDGHRVNDAIYTSAPTGSYFPLDLDLVERVEIIRGPGSSLYGTNAMFAVVNVVTKNPGPIDAVRVRGETGSYGAFGTRVEMTGHLGEEVGFVLSGCLMDVEGADRAYREFSGINRGVAVGSDAERLNRFFGKAAWRGGALQVYRSYRDKEAPTAPWGTVFNDPGTALQDTYLSANLSHRHSLGKKWTLESRLSLNRYDFDGQYVYNYSETDEPQYETNIDDSVGESIVTEAFVDGRISARHRVVAGLSVNADVREEQRNYDRFETYVDSRTRSVDTGIYVQHEYRPSSAVTLSGGVRLDHHASFGEVASPRLAVILMPSSSTSLKLLYGTAFRAPNPFELSYVSVEFKRPDHLDPETIRTWELAVNQALTGNLFLGAGLFTFDLDGLVTLTTDPEDDLLVFRNVDRVRSRGVELELRRVWASGITGRASYSYQETRNLDTSEILSNAPKHMARANVVVPVFDRSTTLALEVQHLSRRATVRGGFVSGHVLTHATIGKQNLFGHLDGQVTVRNVFDVSYADPGSEEHVQESIPQDGRNVRFRLSYGF